MRSNLQEVVDESLIPGAVILIAKQGEIILHEAVGKRQQVPKDIGMTRDTIFDLASLTKVIATWPAICRLLASDILRLEGRVADYIDGTSMSPAAQVSIRQLLTHTAGLPASTFVQQFGSSNQAIVSGICSSPLEYEPGKRVVYSNRGFILLGAIIEAVSKQTLDQYVFEQIWRPAGMTETCFNPHPSFFHRVAPTEYRAALNACQLGIVHDENAAWMGGVAGHAGVFSTSQDLAAFCAMIMAGGIRKDGAVLENQIIQNSLCNQTEGLSESRGYAWVAAEETSSRGTTLAVYGHKGYTGTAIWLVPSLDMFVILLTNRVHPSRDNSAGIQQLRTEVLRASLAL
ncbi:MAG: serine hydrolase domain-containing protein [Armatimonadota bacterium]